MKFVVRCITQTIIRCDFILVYRTYCVKEGREQSSWFASLPPISTYKIYQMRFHLQFQFLCLMQSIFHSKNNCISFNSMNPCAKQFNIFFFFHSPHPITSSFFTTFTLKDGVVGENLGSS